MDFLNDGEARSFGPYDREFEYRESVFKRNNDWLLLDLWLELPQGEADALRARAKEIRALRDEKFPPSMSCAGSISKNFYLSALPSQAVASTPQWAVRGD